MANDLNLAGPGPCTVSRRFCMRQIENVLYEHPGIDEVAVFFLQNDEGREEQLAAFIVPRQAELNENEIIDFLRQSKQLESGAIPQLVKFVPRIPKSPSGKVLKLRLLEDNPF